MTCRIRIKIDEAILAQRPERKPNIQDRIKLNIAIANVSYHRILPAKEGWIVVATSQEEGEKILKSQTQEELKKQGMEAVPPPELLALRTIVIKKCDPFIFMQETDFIQEINKEAPYTIDKIQEIYLMPQHNIMKVKLKSIEIANKIKQQGLLLLGTSIAPFQIETERYALPRQCMKCFDYSHSSAECNKTTKICSECSSPNHTWRECGADNIRKCTQCHGPHRTFSQLCQIRKKAIREAIESKQLKEEETQHKPYSSILKMSSRQTTEAVKKSMADAVKVNTQETRQILKQTNEETNKNIKEMITTAVKEEMTTLYDNLKTQITGIITQEMMYHTTSIKEEIKEFREELRRERGKARKVIKVSKRRLEELNGSTQDEMSLGETTEKEGEKGREEEGEKWITPKNPVKLTKVIERKKTPAKPQGTYRFSLNQDNPIAHPTWDETETEEGEESDVQRTTKQRRKPQHKKNTQRKTELIIGKGKEEEKEEATNKKEKEKEDKADKQAKKINYKDIDIEQIMREISSSDECSVDYGLEVQPSEEEKELPKGSPALSSLSPLAQTLPLSSPLLKLLAPSIATSTIQETIQETIKEVVEEKETETHEEIIQMFREAAEQRHKEFEEKDDDDVITIRRTPFLHFLTLLSPSPEMRAFEKEEREKGEKDPRRNIGKVRNKQGSGNLKNFKK